MGNPESIKLRKKMKICYEWLEQCNLNKSQNKKENIVEEKKENDSLEIDGDNLLEQQLKISRDKTYKETELMQDEIIQNILNKDPSLNILMIDEILWLIKNRVSFNQGFTEQIVEALSS